MLNPIPGKQYTVVQGDTLSLISAKAYGDSEKWPTIWEANQQQFRSNDPDLILPGGVIFIPEDPAREDLKTKATQNRLSRSDKDKFTLIVEGREIPVTAARVVNSMDTLTDTWSASLSWVPGLDKDIDRLLKKYQYPKSEVYIGSTLVNAGFVYTIGNQLTDNGRIKNIIGYSKIADAIDSTIRPPYEQTKVTLKQRAETLLKKYGIQVEYELENDSQFDRVTAEPEDTIGKHLLELVAQRAALINSTKQGNVRIFKANTSGKPLTTLEEGNPIVSNWSGTWDGRKRFNSYKALSQTPGDNSSFAVAKDDNIPKSRFLTFKANDTTSGDVQAAAFWRRSKQVAESLRQQLPVQGWYTPEGILWEENNIVTVISETLEIPNGFNYLLKSVEYIFEENNRSSVLNLVPPQAYTGEDLIEP